MKRGPCQEGRTTKEASQLLGLVRMPHTVHESRVFVCLHASLDAIERERGDGRQDAGCAGCDLGAIALDEHLLLSPHLLSMVCHLRLLLAAPLSPLIGRAGGGGAALRGHDRRL